MLEQDTRGTEAAEPVPPSLNDLLGHSRTVFLVCFGLTRNRADAEDLAQETYLRAWRRFDRLPGGDAAKAWITFAAAGSKSSLAVGRPNGHRP